MNFSFGVYEILAYSVPGGLHMLFVTYVLERLGWIEVDSILEVPSVLLLVLGLGGGLVLGNMIYPIATMIVRNSTQR